MASAACNRARLAVTASAFALVVAAGPALAQDAAPSQDATSVGDIIVTAQKREESIQDVPIAVTALSAENLDAMKIEGGSELMRAVPNVSFSKSNFSMYNFAIRGIGTKAISAGSDPAVAVSFNNAPLIRNRLFEQEYFDVNRVEVLRGPQGTLFGRNATAGVVNMIPNLPGPDFTGMMKGEVGNYGTVRGQGMINIPVADTFWVRAAGAFTKRDGFDYNTFTERNVNDRDLWSTRLSAAWQPTNSLRTNLIWEHFEEDDQRSRTGKQLCTRDPGPESVGSFVFSPGVARGRLSQGCLAKSLYEDAAYSAPNGGGLSQIFMLSQIAMGTYFDGSNFITRFIVDEGLDPYLGVTQSRDLREISATFDPKYNAINDVFQFNLEYDLGESLTLFSQTVYTKDKFESSQDYARYVSNPIFNSRDGLTDTNGDPLGDDLPFLDGFYLDPQLGLSNRMESSDLSRSDNRQFYQEFRVQSESDGPFNFVVGINYIDFKSQDDYFVFNNTFTALAEMLYNGVFGQNLVTNNCSDGSQGECVYVDKSSINDLAGDGHNYFRSKNAIHTKSYGIFGETYIDFSDNLSLTAGLRYTKDKKVFTPYPSQLLLGSWDLMGYGPASGGNVVRGYPAMPDIKQSWDAMTGRLVLDWKPTDSMMFYASYARGYKGGGANPPRADLNPSVVQYQPLPDTFDPEYVNAFEVAAKTQWMDGRLRFNATAFYYDYKDYQVSQIVDRIALNENFDAESMGLEFETVYYITDRFRIDANLGFLKTRIGDGESSIDVMNRTQGNEDWMVVRPWVQVPSNCIAPKKHVEAIMSDPLVGSSSSLYVNALAVLCGGAQRLGSFDPDFEGLFPFWLFLGFEYNPLTDAPNGGRGFAADLSGNELPNAPRVTANIGAQYEMTVGEFDVVIRGDYYRQSSSYFRIYNTEYDRLKGWDNLGASMSIRHQNGLELQAYVKNIFDDAPIVDAFTNSDDSMLTTNVFTLDPRTFGFSIKKYF